MIRIHAFATLVIFLLISGTAQACESGIYMNSCCVIKDSDQKYFDLKDNISNKNGDGEFGTISNPVRIWVGGKNTPYSDMGEDLRRMMACEGIKFDTTESQGSGDIIKAVGSNVNAKFGIVQFDILKQWLTDESADEKYRKAASHIRVVADMHTEEVHLIARKGIETWSDLAGKKVFIGVEGSGTRFTVKNIIAKKRKLETPLEETESTSSTTAIADLLSGELDAMFAVVGAPAGNIEQHLLKGSSDINLLSTVSDDDKEIKYSIETIPAATYPNQKNDVKTYAVKAVLVTYDWETTPAVFQHLCGITAELYSSLEGGLLTLKALAREEPKNWASKSWLSVPANTARSKNGIAKNGVVPRSQCIARNAE